MALPTITPADFVGWIKISADTFQQVELQGYINRFYSRYLYKVLGADAVMEITDNDPIFQKWSDILNGVVYFNTRLDKNIQLDPLLEKVRQFIYFEFVRDDFLNTNTGNVRNLNENSIQLAPIETSAIATSRYNDGIDYVNCQLLDFLANYQTIEHDITGFIDNGGNSYTIETDSTFYLVEGDTVTIDRVEYVISNLIVDTSFDIVSTDATSFEGVYSFKPFENVPNCPLEYIVV